MMLNAYINSTSTFTMILKLIKWDDYAVIFKNGSFILANSLECFCSVDSTCYNHYKYTVMIQKLH